MPPKLFLESRSLFVLVHWASRSWDIGSMRYNQMLGNIWSVLIPGKQHNLSEKMKTDSLLVSWHRNEEGEIRFDSLSAFSPR